MQLVEEERERRKALPRQKRLKVEVNDRLTRLRDVIASAFKYALSVLPEGKADPENLWEYTASEIKQAIFDEEERARELEKELEGRD